jgi:vancomycin resistance protein YoaR
MTKSRRNARNLMRLLTGILLAMLLACAIGVLALFLSASHFRNNDTIARNVTVAGVDVGGLPRGEALTRLETEWVSALPTEMTLVHGDQRFRYSREELGAQLQVAEAVDAALRIGREGNALQQVVDRLRLLRASVDVPVRVAVNEGRAAEKVAEVAARVNRPPVDAKVTVTEGEEVDVVPGKQGILVDEKATLQALCTARADPQQTETVVISQRRDPNITASDLAHLEVVLGSFSTQYSAGKVDRTHNLQLAIKAINGTVVMPGETFSANQAIGRRDEARGFREAPIFVDGEITPSTGGGVCQVATTIYNAALLAGLPIVERHHHSMPVPYADAGRDATVYWGQLDLRFRNDTGSPIVVLGSMSGSRVCVRIVGKRSAKKRVRIERSGISDIPFETIEKPDPTLEEGKRKIVEKGRKGVRVTVYRITVRDDGSEQRETLHTDVYRPHREIVLVGTKKPEAKPDVLGPSTGPDAAKGATEAGRPGDGNSGQTTKSATKTTAKPQPPKTHGSKPAVRPGGSAKRDQR